MTPATIPATAAFPHFIVTPVKALTVLATALGIGFVGSAASAAPLQSGTYSFAVSSSAPPAGTCTGPSDDSCIHNLTSVTIGGTTYTDFTFPSGYLVGGFAPGSNVQSRIQGVAGDYVFSSPTYAADMLANVFTDMDLNKYQQVDSGAGAGFSTFTYPNDVPATSDFFFITTERNGNNSQLIQAFDSIGNALGSVTVTRNSSDYSNTGVNVGLNQNSFISIIPMSDFNVSADPLNPSEVRSLRISYSGNDGADHKTFIVGSQTIGTVVADDDDYSSSPVDGVAGGAVGSVLDNDDLNGGSVATDGSATTITVSDDDGLTGVTIADNGTITVPAGSTPGTYSIEYELCDEADPTACDTAIATVVVSAPPIEALNDNYSTSPVVGATGGTVGSVLDNDRLNGSAVATDGSETTISVTNDDGLTGVTIADDGTITVPAATPMGTYTIVYELCDEANPGTCDTATAIIVVGAPAIDAVNDDYSGAPVGGVVGGTVGSVLDNDQRAGSAVATDGSQTMITVTNPGGLTGVTIADNGTVSVPAGTPVGTYNVAYQLCDQLTPAICDTATATIVVDNTDLIDAIADDLTAILEDDLAVTMAEQGARMGTYATGALERLKSRTGQQCAAAATLQARRILFDTDKAIITPQSDRVLSDIAGILATCRGSTFEIVGHTDSRASDAYNIALSQRRVNAVLRALTARDVDTNGFVARGYGERRPVASNDTDAGMAQNRRVEFTLIEDEAIQHNTCGDEGGGSRDLEASADENGVTLNGSLVSESHDCANDRWSIVEGTVSHFDTDSGLSQTSVNVSYRRERFVAPDTLRGYFVGVYGSQSDVDREATGEIDGAGLNAGIYGAKRLRDNLYLDYYLGAATGVHDFDLAFDNALGTITATGDYTYVAGFAGAAISGELDYGEYTLSPRTGLELAYSPGGDVGVDAALGGVTQSGTLTLDSVSGSAVFAEIRAERDLSDQRSTIALTPRLTCYQSIGNLGSDCGIGAALELASSDLARGMVYAIKLEGERGSSFTRNSISASVSRPIGRSSLNADAGVTQDGAVSFGSSFELKF